MLWRCKSVRRCISYTSFQKVNTCLGKWRHRGNHISIRHTSVSFASTVEDLNHKPRMTSVFWLPALNFIWIFCSALAQIVIGLSPDSVFSLLSVAIFSTHFSLVHSLKCVLDLVFKHQACFPSEITSVLISQPSTQVRASAECQKTLCFWESFLSQVLHYPSLPLLLQIQRILS